MTDKREKQLSAIIDDDRGFEWFKTGPWDPEMAAMADTVHKVRSVRVFEQPSPGFAERGWQNILERVKAEQPAATRNRGNARKRRGWITAAASLLVVAAVLSNPWWRTPPTAGASEIRVTGSGLVADLGVREALFPRYAGSMERISYGIGDQIFLWDRTVGKETPMYPEFQYARDAAWSPDGKQVAFSGYPSAKQGPVQPGIWVGPSDGSRPVLIARPFDPDTAYEGPAWSPDGKKIAFTATQASLSDATGVVYKRSVMVMDADGAGLTKVADGQQPAWSRDGSRLAYTAETAAGVPEIRISGPTGEETRKIAEGQMPVWSPHHPFVVFTKIRTEHRGLETNADGKETYAADVTYRELWAVNVESGTETRLTTGEFPQQQIDALLRESKQRGEAAAVYTVSGVTSDENPAWSPDGTRILFTRSTHEEQGPHFMLQELFIDYR